VGVPELLRVRAESAQWASDGDDEDEDDMPPQGDEQKLRNEAKRHRSLLP
jgi:hypothetical protein